jgi:hypothetical protein
VHWAYADLETAIKRQIQNGKLRLSRADLDTGLARHLWSVDEQSIRSVARQFDEAPQVLRERWLMQLADWFNSFLNGYPWRKSRGRVVSDPERWNDGLQLDVFDLWADRRIYASKARMALRACCFGQRPD